MGRCDLGTLVCLFFSKIIGGPGGLLGGAFSFLEEILPFTDIIPTFTIAWFIQNTQPENPSRRNQNTGTEIVDAEVIEIK